MDYEPETGADDPGQADPPDPWQQGWWAGAEGSLAPNPYDWSAPEFPVWFAGYFAAQRTIADQAAAEQAAAAAEREAAEQAAAAVEQAAAEPEEQPPEPVEPDAQPALAILSPGFRTRPPMLRNPELIPPHIFAAMDASWSKPVFEDRAITLTSLSDAWVVHEGLVFDSGLNLIPGTDVAFTEEDIREARAAIQADQAAGRVWYHEGSYVLAKKRAPMNYGHFLLECFPRASVARRLMPEQGSSIVVHRCPGHIMEVSYAALRRAGIHLDKIEMTGVEPHQFEQLILVDGLATHGSYMSPLVIQEISRIAEGIAPGPHRKLYVTRNAVGTRALVNEAALVERLEREGYVAIDPGEMTLEQQIATFAGAESIIGVLGAGLTNIVFSPPGTRVALIVPATMPDTFFWFISQHRSHEYLEVRCPELPGDVEPSWNREIAINPADIGFLAQW